MITIGDERLGGYVDIDPSQPFNLIDYKPCVAYISGYISNADTGKVTFRVWNLGVDSDIMEYSGDVLSIKAIKIKD